MEKDLSTTLPVDLKRIDIEVALEEWWQDEQADSALPGDAAPAPSAGIMRPAIEIDSHRAVRALIMLEEVVKFTIPETEIQEGGYESFEEMKEHLIPRVLALYEQKRKKEDA